MARATKETFKRHFGDWTRKNYDKPLTKFPPETASRLMSRFFVTQVLSKTFENLVPDDGPELEAALIDGSGDSGIDFIYRSDHSVLLIQSKWRNSGNAEQAEAVGRFLDAPQRLYQAATGKQDHNLSKRLRESLRDIDWHTDDFHLYFITTGNLTPSVKDRGRQGIASIPELPDFSEPRVRFHLLGEAQLDESWREARSLPDAPAKAVSIQFLPNEEMKPWSHYPSNKRSLYVGEVSGTVLRDAWLNQGGDKLFAHNIRLFAGEKGTNKAIISTARNRPEEFVYFNNGLTAVASSVEPDLKENALTCQDFSIINGAQTLRSLVAATTQNGGIDAASLRDVRVLLRVLTYDSGAENEKSFVDDVTRYNNTQTAVKVSDFRSNDVVQLDLMRRFQQVTRKDKRYLYKNKRSVDKPQSSLIFTLDDFTKTVHAFRCGPHDVYGGQAYLFDQSLGQGYKKVFPEPDQYLTDRDFEIIAGTFFLCDQIREDWQTERKQRQSASEDLDPSLERRWMIFYAAGEMLRQRYAQLSKDLSTDLRLLAKPNTWKDDPEAPLLETVKQLGTDAMECLTEVYKQKKEDKGGEFIQRNWFRDPRTLEDIKRDVSKTVSRMRKDKSHWLPGGPRARVEPPLLARKAAQQCAPRWTQSAAIAAGRLEGTGGLGMPGSAARHCIEAGALSERRKADGRD